MSRILITGGAGLLGTELQKLGHEIIAPTKEQSDITSLPMVAQVIGDCKPDIMIHAAAIKDNRFIEKNPISAIHTNIVGTANVASICIARNIRLVYISTDYIYEGDRGNYKETDPIKPFNLYAWTKLGGECSVVAVPNHLIIRTSFGAKEFPYTEAFTDKWTSKDYVSVIAPMILEAALSPLTGVLNIGTDRKTLYQFAYECKDVLPIKISDTNFNTPYDTSLNTQKWLDYKSSTPIAKTHCKCRICGSTKLTKYLDLGLMPLANNLEFTSLAAKNTDRYPLQILFCEDCALSQLSVVINPEKMFSYYTYRSSVNQGYIDHCTKMARSLSKEYNFNLEFTHIDIAGNDGALLKAFDSEFEFSNKINVDPASNLTAIAESNGIRSVTEFWGLEVAKILPKSDLITATNVFAHLDNVTEFIQAAKLSLRSNGILVIENPYIVDFIETLDFGQTYFEHVSFISLWPLMQLCTSLDMKVIDVSKHAIHGGTMRYVIAHSESGYDVSDAVHEQLQIEDKGGYHSPAKYLAWSDAVKKCIKDFGSGLLELKKAGHSIAGFAASAKGSTLLNCAGINTDIIDYIADQTPEKIGKFCPGTGIPIYGIDKIMKTKPDYIVVLSWNFQDEIMNKVRGLGFEGKFIVPVPEFRII